MTDLILSFELPGENRPAQVTRTMDLACTNCTYENTRKVVLDLDIVRNRYQLTPRLCPKCSLGKLVRRDLTF